MGRRRSNYCAYVYSNDEYLQNVAANINYEMFVQNLTFKELAKKTGLKESTLTQHVKSPGTLRQSEIVEIAKALKISPFKLVCSKLTYEEVKQQ